MCRCAPQRRSSRAIWVQAARSARGMNSNNRPPDDDTPMPRNPLVVITALVVVVHWLVLQGVPLVWQAPPPAPRSAHAVWNTRSIAMAAPAAVLPARTAPEAATPAPGTTPTSPPQPRPVRPAQSPASPEAAQVANAGAGDAADGMAARASNRADSPAEAALAADAPMAAPNPEAIASVTPDAVIPPPPPETAAPPAPPSTSAGIDIRAPAGAHTATDTSSAPAPAQAAAPVRLPAPARLVFDVNGQAKKFSYSAQAELLWQHDGSRYEAQQEISAFLMGTRRQRSVGQMTAQGLQPERFSDRSRSEQAAHFDHTQGRVTFSANTPAAAIGTGAQDRLSVFIQLGALLAAQPERFVPGTQITLTTASARSADRWTFTVEGTETLDLPAGPTPALKLVRLPHKDYDQKAELWVAPALGYLPVRIQLTQANGDFADLRLRSAGAP